jgi:predicted nucleotidyltransferase
MNSGLTKNWIRTELSQKLTGMSEVEAVFGFGSFFRDEAFGDVDLAVVFREDCDDTLSAFEQVLERLKTVDEVLGLHLDVIPFTAKEFKSRPLREHAQLVPLFPPRAISHLEMV